MRQYLPPPVIKFNSHLAPRLPFEMQDGGEYELVVWGDSVILHASNYVEGTRPYVIINTVRYHLRLELYLTEGGLYQPHPDRPYRAVSIDRWRSTAIHDYSDAAKRKAEETLIPFINDVLRGKPEVVDAGHLTRLNNKVFRAEEEWNRKLKEANDANLVMRAAEEEERSYIAQKGQPA